MLVVIKRLLATKLNLVTVMVSQLYLTSMELIASSAFKLYNEHSHTLLFASIRPSVVLVYALEHCLHVFQRCAGQY